MVQFHVLTWDARDEDHQHIIRMFGKTIEGKSVCVTTPFKPYFFLKVPANMNAADTIKHVTDICPDIVRCDVVTGRDMEGFQNDEKRSFIQVTCNNLLSRRFISNKLRKTNKDTLKKAMAQMKQKECDVTLAEERTRRLSEEHERFAGSKQVEYLRGILERSKKDVTKIEAVSSLRLYEANLDPVLRFMHRTGIQSTGWVNTGLLNADGTPTCIQNSHALVDIDLYCAHWKCLKPYGTTDAAPFVMASLDIECYSSTGKFPDPQVPGDVCFQIAISLLKFGDSEPFEKICFCYKQTDTNLEGSIIKSYNTEKDMLMAFSEYLREKDIDIITGWNIFGFDLEYIIERGIYNVCPLIFFQMSKLKNYTCELLKKKLSSSALGDNELKLVPMPGRFIFDLFHEVKREYKLDSYKLDNVSKLYLGDNKIDMSPKEMFRRFEEGDPVKLKEVAEYCIKDTLLPHRLVDKLCTFVNLLEMAKATWVPLSYLVERGQQIKVFSQLTKKAREMGFKVPTYEYGHTDNTGYVGATVLEAQSGAYYTPITALDFEGLYPSIMMAHNLCYSTRVLDKKYMDIPGIKYEKFGDHVFAQDVPSILPSILIELKAFRKQAKKDMARATGAMKQMYNGKQLAYKISMNSVYGFTGASKGILPCVAIASTTTMKGRSMIDETKAYVEKHYPGSIVRYGDTDSVMVEFDVQGRTGKDAIEYSWELGEKAAGECTKLFKAPNNLELEKVYCPYFLYSKKRYAAKLWTKNKEGEMNMDYIDVKGLQLVRRDNTPYMREVCKELLDVVLDSNGTDAPKALARKRAVELLEGDVSNEKLILSQSLSDSYKVKGERVSITSDEIVNISQAHVQVVRKMRDRQPGSEPQSGDRVPYILINTGDPKARAFEKSEDPIYAREHRLPVDYPYYFLNKFLNPVCDLLDPLFENVKDEIFGELLMRAKPPKKTKKNTGEVKQLMLSDIFKKETPK
jgi:DNA polymerase delta subunit 1